MKFKAIQLETKQVKVLSIIAVILIAGTGGYAIAQWLLQKQASYTYTITEAIDLIFIDWRDIDLAYSSTDEPDPLVMFDDWSDANAQSEGGFSWGNMTGHDSVEASKVHLFFRVGADSNLEGLYVTPTDSGDGFTVASITGYLVKYYDSTGADNWVVDVMGSTSIPVDSKTQLGNNDWIQNLGDDSQIINDQNVKYCYMLEITFNESPVYAGTYTANVNFDFEDN